MLTGVTAARDFGWVPVLLAVGLFSSCSNLSHQTGQQVSTTTVLTAATT